MSTVIAVRQLWQRAESKTILHDVNLEMRPGRFIGLIGPNGSGKSTLLRAMGGLRRPAAGEVLLDGASLHRMKPKAVARHIAYVPQDLSIELDFTAEEVVMLGRYAHRGRFASASAADREAVREAMRTTGIDSFADRRVTELSGGQRQMVFIAKALAQQPRILLLDEPISALDIRHQLRVMKLLLERTNDGLLIVAALHDLNLAARFCDELILLRHGHVLASGAPECVMTTERLRQAYGVEASIRRDERTGKPAVTALDEVRMQAAY
ncbi:ABC transporter ATP-binding protein [Paenibacillus oleatilyticus]|uniref:ABC transporter ATP-binding protein n=1 Tax=Paenibacillus oleatilyticus TaxID=2594886 RepID=A0ABV4V025_9BACL